LDLFGGSGSTLIGAEQTGRKAFLMELDPKYCDVIVKRWEDFTGKKAELIKQGGFERFKQYKDSISTDATNRREADFAKAAANRGMTTAEYSKYLVKNAKKPDAQPDGLEVGKACKRGDTKGSCVDGGTRGGDSLKDIRR
jgi:hypothetical protein